MNDLIVKNELIENDVKIENMIYEVRGVQVILDRDLALLYNVETKVLIQSVKRNIKRGELTKMQAVRTSTIIKIFDKQFFSPQYINEIKLAWREIDLDIVKKILSKVFYNFTDILIEKAQKNEFDAIVQDYYSFAEY